MIDIKSIKKNILSAAYQGNLSKATDSTTDDLDKLHASLKKYQEVTDSEKLIKTPSHWRWSRLGYISNNHGQKTPSDTFSYLDIGTLDNVHQRLSKEENIVLAKDAPSRARKIVELGDVIYSTVRPYLHNICIIDKTFSVEPIASTAFCVMAVKPEVIINKFLFYWLLTPEFDKYANGDPSKGTLYPAIGEKDLLAGVIPIPPLQEQVEIVEIIDEAFNALSILDSAQSAYSSDLEVLKSKIIDAGIQGKLTEQLPEDGNAEDLYAAIQEEKNKLIKEKKIKTSKALPEITEDEIPFEIPDNWKWVRFGDVMINRDSERIPVSVADRKKLAKIYDYYGASGIIDKVDNYLFDKPLLLIGEDGANLLSRSTPIAFIATGEYWVNNHAHVLDCDDRYIELRYIMWYINGISLEPYVTGTAQPKLNQAHLNSIPIALPPLKEQKRIVDIIESIVNH